MAKKIKTIINRFDEIARERQFHLREGVALDRFQVEESRETSSIINADVVYGRNGDKEKIIEVLRSNASHGEDDLFVFSILGIGGLGKTTLAQLVYNDQRIVEHFDERIWVCVSEIFEAKRLTKMILESLTRQPYQIQDLDPMQRQIQEKLSGKKFLVVLDDVWNADSEKWFKLKSSLKCGAKGSSILVTTRQDAVSSIVSPFPPYPLTILSQEECWCLFKECAFGVGKEEIADLVEIGKGIVKKCGGVPLAVKTLGRLMCSERKLSEWLRVKDSKLWELPQEKGTGILPALRLSYNHLPSHLKQCFTFCSIYPKDYVMNKEELILLWMANGFLQPDGKMELEDYGDSVFNNLLHRSFFQDIEKDEYGIIKTCKLLDLMHDLACSVSENECIVVGDSSKTLQKGIRHCSVVSNSPEAAKLVDLESLSKFNPVLCTELLLGYYNEHIEVTFRNLDHIRALDLSKTRTEMVPVSIGKMKQLRYLNLSMTRIKSLPESICNLWNLQSLKLAYCSSLLKLPERTSKMSGLRHLDVKGCSKLTEMPIGMGQLSQLQTLNFFVVSSENGRGIKELQGLNYLRGSIDIEGLEHVRDSEGVREPILLRKPNISTVRLCWSTKEGVDGKLQQKVLEHGLQPEQSLKALFIEGYRGVILPTWMVLLQKLVKISLKDCNSCLRLPPLGQLPLLKVLIIMNTYSVKSISDEFYGGNLVQGFPALEVLQLDQMPSLEEWSPPSHVENPRQLFACLKELKIFGCPLLKSFPF